MLPETSFHKLGKNLMFAVINNTIYHTENAAPSDNFMYLCGLSFPLKKSENLRNMEKRYLQRNSENLKEFQNQYSKNIRSDENLIARIDSEIRGNKNLHFFITQVIPAYCGELCQNNIRRKLERVREEYIFEKLLGGNVAVINKRVYPLNEVRESSVIRLDWKNYCFDKSIKTIDMLESEFKFNLQENLKKNVLEKIQQSEGSKKKLSGLEGEIRDLTAKGHIRIVGNCYEYGDIGYDPKLGRVYCFFKAHYNKTTGKHYKERQVAVSISITPEGLKTDTQIISRNNENSDFFIDYSTPCLGKMPGGSTTGQIVGSLVKSALNINKQHSFHE
ncbi:MAG: hypothetical protein PHH54_00910 [Candidatus Nanoarchaeia archaeon]|nr:hypothetical protein [Candidatus Nanoarchaeia archaeon]MDD5740523.1 hypothetical protein [Candidatus Nanoarchaeia archaeon]